MLGGSVKEVSVAVCGTAITLRSDCGNDTPHIAVAAVLGEVEDIPHLKTVRLSHSWPAHRNTAPYFLEKVRNSGVYITCSSRVDASFHASMTNSGSKRSMYSDSAPIV